MAKRNSVIWRSTNRGREQNCYRVSPAGAEILIGYITRKGGRGAVTYTATQVTDTDVKRLGECSGDGSLANCIAEARAMVEAAQKGETK